MKWVQVMLERIDHVSGTGILETYAPMIGKNRHIIKL
jgi:hypothetical protein